MRIFVRAHIIFYVVALTAGRKSTGFATISACNDVFSVRIEGFISVELHQVWSAIWRQRSRKARQVHYLLFVVRRKRALGSSDEEERGIRGRSPSE